MNSQSDSAPVFAVGIAALGHGQPIRISEEIFRDATLSKANLVALTQIELSYDLLIRNFTALNEGQLHAALQNKMGVLNDRTKFMSWLQEFNRLVGNLLSSARGYLDQTDRILKMVFGEASKERVSFKEECSIQYDSVLGYRLMENIRNYHQHYSLGVASISFPMKRIEKTVDSQISFSAEPYFLRTRLQENKKLSKKLKDDLLILPERIEVLPHVHDYVEALSSVHEHVRKQVEPPSEDWMHKITKPRQILAESNPTKEFTVTTPVALFEFPDDKLLGPLSTNSISEELFEDRIHLLCKNRQLKNVRNLFVTSQETRED